MWLIATRLGNTDLDEPQVVLKQLYIVYYSEQFIKDYLSETIDPLIHQNSLNKLTWPSSILVFG